MYAIISAGNKQYKISQGETIFINKVNQADGSAISFDAIMVVNEGNVKVGTPTVAGVTVERQDRRSGQGREDYDLQVASPRRTAHRRASHRQPYTKVEITAINA